jgi:hypothetical protein
LAVASIRKVPASTGVKATSTLSSPSGWQSGIRSPVLFAAMMPASLATARTSPLAMPPSRIRASVDASIRTSPLARADLAVTSLPETSTIRLAPRSSK